MTIQLKSNNSFLQFLVKPKEKTIHACSITQELPDEIYLLISSFLKPKEIIQTLVSLNSHLYRLCSSDLIWKKIVQKYSYYLPSSKPKDFGASTYKELFMQRTWNLSTKYKTKGLKLHKSLRTVSNPTKSSVPAEIKLIATKTCTLYNKSLVRIRFDERMYGCYVGIVSKLNLDLVMKSTKTLTHNHLRYMRDGSIGGIQRIFNETIDRIRDVGEERLHRVYFTIDKNDVLSVYLDMDKCRVQFVVNDDPNCMMTVSNVREMMLGSPIHLVFGLPFSQKFTILNNTNDEEITKRREVSVIQSMDIKRK